MLLSAKLEKPMKQFVFFFGKAQGGGSSGEKKLKNCEENAKVNKTYLFFHWTATEQ